VAVSVCRVVSFGWSVMSLSSGVKSWYVLVCGGRGSAAVVFGVAVGSLEGWWLSVLSKLSIVVVDGGWLLMLS
jgi:hypothetical protein